jgi:hypothetical protein
MIWSELHVYACVPLCFTYNVGEETKISIEKS